ncbi:MAG: LysM peptidoglycan-binding domain-containing protein [Parachlamydiaceae bacterium]|nr:LysM peptidoglycan-binding domain-containing protein [Parachlamydiaceae bacterium]
MTIAYLIERFNNLRLQPVKAVICTLLFFCVFSCGELSAVRNRYYDDENATLVKEMRDSLDDIRHEVNNHESEIRIYDEKLKNLENIIDSVRDQVSESSQAHKEQLKGNSNTLESKITSIENIIKGVVTDLRQFKTHANDSSIALAQYKQKISELEKIVEQQNQNLDHLQAAMRSLMEALVVKESAPSKPSAVSMTAEISAPGLYRVKAGDSLEKIARLHQTTVSVIKDLNGLSHDRIVVGQVLKIPEK